MVINFLQRSGKTVAVSAYAGMSLMEAAVGYGVDGIDGLCGGACACATCHVYVGPLWWDAVGGPNPEELALLQESGTPRPTSRLACQIRISEALDGMTVEVADRSK